MNPFGRHELTTPAPEISSGTEAIRQRLYARHRKTHLAKTAMDLQLSLQSLQAFAEGTIDQLPEPAMRALCQEFFPYNVELDLVADKLVDTSPPAKPLGVLGPVYDRTQDPRYVPLGPSGFVLPAALIAGKPRRRPGFAE